MSELDKADDLMLSVLIPTCNRYGRLLRSLTYLSGISRLAEFSSLVPRIKIFIADGTNPEILDASGLSARDKVMSLIEALQETFDVSYNSMPQLPLLDRVCWLARQVRSPYLTVLGDEDMLVFDSISEWLCELQNNRSIVAITGVYLDIKGFERFGSRLKINLEEGLAYGINIDEPRILDRLLQHRTFSASGVPPISYSIMRSDIFSKFAQYLEKDTENFTYCGAESLLVALIIAAGEVRIKKMPYILRDFTYIDHSSTDKKWSNIDKDRAARFQALHILNDLYGCFESDAEMNHFFQILQTVSLSAGIGRFAALNIIHPGQKAIAREVVEGLNASTLAVANKSWKSTLRYCYSRSDVEAVGAMGVGTFLGRLTRRIQRGLSR